MSDLKFYGDKQSSEGDEAWGEIIYVGVSFATCSRKTGIGLFLSEPQDPLVPY